MAVASIRRMSHAALSLLVFGVYLLVIGVVILIVPNGFIRIFGFPPTEDVWIRVMAMLLMLLGCYYVLAARAELLQLVRWSVPVRASVILFFGAFVLLDLAGWPILLFSVVDLAAAGWTAVALRRS